MCTQSSAQFIACMVSMLGVFLISLLFSASADRGILFTLFFVLIDSVTKHSSSIYGRLIASVVDHVANSGCDDDVDNVDHNNIDNGGGNDANDLSCTSH